MARNPSKLTLSLFTCLFVSVCLSVCLSFMNINTNFFRLSLSLSLSLSVCLFCVCVCVGGGGGTQHAGLSICLTITQSVYLSLFLLPKLLSALTCAEKLESVFLDVERSGPDSTCLRHTFWKLLQAHRLHHINSFTITGHDIATRMMSHQRIRKLDLITTSLRPPLSLSVK